jgi:hypothetical protein
MKDRIAIALYGLALIASMVVLGLVLIDFYSPSTTPPRQAFNAAPVPPDTITLEMIVGADTCYTSVRREVVLHDAATVRVMRFRCETRNKKGESK